MVGKSNSLGNENRIQMSKIFFLVSTPSRNILEAKEMDFFFYLDRYRASFFILAFTTQTVCFYIRPPHRHGLHNMKAIAEKTNVRYCLSLVGFSIHTDQNFPEI